MNKKLNMKLWYIIRQQECFLMEKKKNGTAINKKKKTNRAEITFFQLN